MSDWRPGATPDTLRLRARLNALIRDFFRDRHVLEVETPILSQAGNTDPNIASFQLEVSGRTDGASRTRWLRTSPEFAMKRLLAAGVGDCYELGRVFRDGEIGRRHNPEFTMLEWYRVDWDHHRLMDEAVDLVAAALELAGRAIPAVHKTTYRELYRHHLGIDVVHGNDHALHDALGEVQIEPAGLTRDDWLDLLMTHRIQPQLDWDTITLVHGYPASQSALARLSADNPPVAQRFELYLGSLELANGYFELADPREQRRRFQRDLALRAQRGHKLPPMDTYLLDALDAGLPECAGVALGVDRLLMGMLGAAEIHDTLPFSFDRA